MKVVSKFDESGLSWNCIHKLFEQLQLLHSSSDLEDAVEDPHNSADDSACLSSDVTWGASDVDSAADIWADDFHSDITFPDDCEPFFDLERW